MKRDLKATAWLVVKFILVALAPLAILLMLFLADLPASG